MGRRCSQPNSTFYVPSIDAQTAKPTSWSCQPEVDLPRSDVTGRGGQFLLCSDGDVVVFDNVSITWPQPNGTW